MAVVAVNPKPEIKISTQIIVGTARISPAKPRTILQTHGCERFRAAISPSRNPIHAPIIVVTKLKEQGFQKPPDLYALKTEYKQLAEQKDQLQRQYAEAKRQMQEYGIIKQNVDGILRTTPGKEQVQER